LVFAIDALAFLSSQARRPWQKSVDFAGQFLPPVNDLSGAAGSRRSHRRATV